MNSCITGDDRINRIRQAERESHIKTYMENPLYASEGWLSKPIRTVLEILPQFENYEKLRILDLGAGVGRNCIPFAKRYHDIACQIDCVDSLELATQILCENAGTYGVAPQIRAITSSIEDFEIRPNEYDLVMAVSTLEHVESEEIFWEKLREIQDGIRKDGIVCLVVNSNVTETDKTTGENIPPQFEINLNTNELQGSLNALFSGWQVLKSTVSRQKYDIPRDNRISVLVSDVVTYAAKRTMQSDD